MLNRLPTAVVATAAFLAITGCGSITNPARLEVFDWGEVEDPSSIEEGIDATVAFGELFVLGQLNTPSKCYRLTATFDRNDSRATLRIRGELANQNCGPGIGGFRYTATIRNLASGTYDLRVIHDVDGAQTQEFTESVEIR